MDSVIVSIQMYTVRVHIARTYPWYIHRAFKMGLPKSLQCMNQEISNGALLHLLHQSGTLTGILYGSRIDIHMCTKELTPYLGKCKFRCCNLIKVEVKLDKKHNNSLCVHLPRGIQLVWELILFSKCVASMSPTDCKMNVFSLTLLLAS